MLGYACGHRQCQSETGDLVTRRPVSLNAVAGGQRSSRHLRKSLDEINIPRAEAEHVHTLRLNTLGFCGHPSFQDRGCRPCLRFCPEPGAGNLPCPPGPFLGNSRHAHGSRNDSIIVQGQADVAAIRVAPHGCRRIKLVSIFIEDTRLAHRVARRLLKAVARAANGAPGRQLKRLLDGL